jgi:hypothetical protein
MEDIIGSTEEDLHQGYGCGGAFNVLSDNEETSSDASSPPPLMYDGHPESVSEDTTNPRMPVRRLSGVFHNSGSASEGIQPRQRVRRPGAQKHAGTNEINASSLSTLIGKLQNTPFQLTVFINSRWYTFRREDAPSDAQSDSISVVVPVNVSR